MVGFRSTDAYSNAVVDNWVQTLSGETGHRIMGARIEYDSVTGLVDIDNVLGGIGDGVTRTAEGVYSLTYESPGKTALIPFVGVGNVAHKAIITSFSTTGCTIKTLSYAGAAWSLDDIAFSLYVVGV